MRAMTGLVLAGGASRRMGSDKALLDIDGRPLVEHVARRLSGVCVEVLVAPGDRALAGLTWPLVADRVLGQGPLAGILGGLAVARTALMAVAAVDMPEVDAGVLADLADRWDDAADAVVPVVAGRPQPLHAVYATAALATLAEAFDAGERSVLGALARGDAIYHTVDDGQWAINLNTPEDLRRYRTDG